MSKQDRTDTGDQKDPPVKAGSLPDEEAMKRFLARPDIRARIQEVLEELRRGSDVPGVTAEELPEFLRRYG